MRIVLDANIFISSFFWGGNPRAVLERAVLKLDEMFVSGEILTEVADVLGRPKFHAGKNEVEFYIQSIEEIAVKITAANAVEKGSRDKADDKYLACALAANADYIISGDVHLLELKEYGGIKIVTAREYLEILREG